MDKPRKIDAIHLRTIQNSTINALSEFKEWLVHGYCLYIPCTLDEIDRLFPIVFTIAMGNMLLLLTPRKLSADQIFKDKTVCMDGIPDTIEKFQQALYQPEKVSNDTRDDGAEEETGILLFIKRMVDGVSILPPQLFKDILPSAFRIFSYYYYDNKPIYVFIHSLDTKGDIVRLYMSNSDYGASVMAYPVIRDICAQMIRRGNRAELLYHYTNKCIGIYPYILPDCIHHVYVNDISLRALSELLRQDKSDLSSIKHVINLEWIHTTYISTKHHCHVAMEMLDMVHYPSLPKTYENLLPHINNFTDLLSLRNHKRLQELKVRYRKLIGIQFYTHTDGHYAYDTNNTRNKSLLPKTVQQFINLCSVNGIGVVLLAPTPYTLRCVHDFSDLPVGLLFGIVSQVHAVVGIDSVCTHIAGVMNIPNLTVWKRYHPLRLSSPNGGKNLCYRPVSKNYSLVALSSQDEGGLSEKMFSILKKILTGTVQLHGGISDCFTGLEEF